MPGEPAVPKTLASVEMPAATSAPRLSQVPLGVRRALDDRSAGRPLEGEEQKLAGPALAHVRVHTDSQAATLADGVGANAFTRGSHIYFGAGRYSGELLRHELGHVVQQERGDVPDHVGRLVPEHHATERTTASALQTVPVSRHAPTPAIHRDPKKPGEDRPVALSLDELWKNVQDKRGLESRVPPHAVDAAEDAEAKAVNDLENAKVAHQEQVRLRRDRGDPNLRTGARVRQRTRRDVRDARAAVLKAEKRTDSRRANASERIPEDNLPPNRQPLGHGSQTYGTIQVTDEQGRRVAIGIDSYRGGLHAEEHSLEQIRRQLDHDGIKSDVKPGRGWRVTVVVDQTVCPDRCRLALSRFAQDYGIDPENVVAYYPEPVERVEGDPVSPKTASRSSHVQAVRLGNPEQVLVETPPPRSTGSGGGGGGSRTSARASGAVPGAEGEREVVSPNIVVPTPDHPAKGGKRLDGGSATGGAGTATPARTTGTAAPAGSPAPGSDLGTVLNPIEIPSDPKQKAELLKDPVKGPIAKSQIDSMNDQARAEHMAKAKKGREEKGNESAVERPIPKAMSTIAPEPINPELESDIPHDQTVRADDDSAETEIEKKSTQWGRTGANATRTDTTETKKSSGSTTETKTDTKTFSMGAGGVGHEWKQREETATPDAAKATEKSTKANVNLQGFSLTNTATTEEGKGTSADPADPDSAKKTKTTRQTSFTAGPGGVGGTGSAAIESKSGAKAEATGGIKAGPGGIEATGTGRFTTAKGFTGHLSVSGKQNVVAGDPQKLDNGTFSVTFTVTDEKGVEIGGGWSKPGGGASVGVTAGSSTSKAEFATRVFATEKEAKVFQMTAAFQVGNQLDSVEKAKSVEGALAMKEGESRGSSTTDTTSYGGSGGLEGAEIGVAWNDAVTRGLTIKRMGGTRVQVTPSISEQKQLAASISAWGAFGNTKSQTEIDATAITFEFDLAREDAKKAFKFYAKNGFPPPMPPAAKWVNTVTGHSLGDDDVYSFAHVGKIGWGEKAWQQTTKDEQGTHSVAGGGQTHEVDLSAIRHLTGDKNVHSDAEITGHLENGKAVDFSAQMTVGGESGSFNRETLGQIFTGAKAAPGVDVKTSGDWTLSADIDPKMFEEMARTNPEMRKAKTREEQLKIYSEMAKKGGAHMISGQVRMSGKKLAWNLELKGDPNFPGASGREQLNAQRTKLMQQLKSHPANAGTVAAEAKDVIESLQRRLAAVSDETKYTDLPDELRQEQKDLVKDHLAQFQSLRNQALSATTHTTEKEDLTKTLNRASSGHGYEDVKKEDREVARLRDKITIHETEISALEREIAGTAKIVNRMFGGGESVRWGEGVKKEVYLEHNDNAKRARATARRLDEMLKASAQKLRDLREKWSSGKDPKDNEANLKALDAALLDQIKIMDTELESLRDAAREAYIITSDAAVGRDWNFYKVIKVDGAARANAISGLTDNDL